MCKKQNTIKSLILCDKSLGKQSQNGSLLCCWPALNDFWNCLWHFQFSSWSEHRIGRIYCRAQCSSLAACECLRLLLGIRHPGSRLECVSSAGGVLADLLLAEAWGGCVALGQSLYRSCHQTFLVLLSLQGKIFVLYLLGLQFDLLLVRLVLQKLL